jgi:hypothetical protein
MEYGKHGILGEAKAVHPSFHHSTILLFRPGMVVWSVR